MKEEVIYEVKVEGVQSIENLTKANKALREERSKLDLQSEKGLKRAQEINSQLDDNTETIKKNSSALEKQRLNVGNYTGALDKLVPGLGATANGFGAMTKQAWAFVANPIGAVIAALGLAIAALTAYFKGSEKGQTDFNKIMNVGAAIVGKFSDLVQYLGGVVFGTLIKGGEKVIGFLNKFVPGFQAATDALSEFLNLDTANKISALEERQVLLNRELITKRDILKEEIEAAKLRGESTKDAKIQTEAFQEATDKINELSKKEKELAQLQSDILIEQAKLSNNTIEANDQIEESKARINQLEKERLSQLKEISVKQLGISEAEKAASKAKEEQLRKEDEIDSEIQRNKRIREIEETQVQEDAILQIKIGSAEKSFALAQKSLDQQIKINDKENKSKQETAKIDFLVQQNKLTNAKTLIDGTAALVKEGSFAAKSLAIASAIINTYQAAAAALAPPPIGAGPLFGPALAAVSIATGLANVAKITSTKAFAMGGLTGQRIGHGDGVSINRSNGDNLLATVKTGEVILNQRQQALLGGDRVFRNIGVPGFASGGRINQVAQASEASLQSNRIFDAISNLTIVATIEDINAGQNRVSVVENRASVI